MERIEVVVAHQDRITLRVGDVFMKVDVDPAHADIEVAAMQLVPVPVPTVLWRHAPVLALAALPGTALGRFGHPSVASDAAWAAVGSIVRRLHDAPLPPWPARDRSGDAQLLDAECAWLVEKDVVSADVVERNRELAAAAIRPFDPVFIHGDLQPSHVFLDGETVTGLIDWSEAGPGDPAFDLASLTLGHPERLDAVLAGYEADIDVTAIRAWWSLRSLRNIRWLLEHGFDPAAPGCEIDVLKAQL
jgi:aminoglycoside phosphotransferase (APT) family kinase protein